MAEMKAAPAAENALSPKLKLKSEIFDFEEFPARDSSFTMFLSNSTFLVAVANPIHEGKPCLDEPTINTQVKTLPYPQKISRFQENLTFQKRGN